MLTRDERIQVINDLSDHVGLTNTIGALITIVFSVSDRAELGNLPTDLNNVQDQATWVVDACLSSRWRLNPSLLELLLVRLTGQGGKGGLMPILVRVQRQEDPNPDPFQARWVLSNQPFLDRGPLRSAARLLVEDIGQPILRVNGPSLSGKTYTAELLSFVMSARPDLHVVQVELAPETGPSYQVEELAESLVLSMEKTDRFPARSNSSYAGALVRWLIRNAYRNSGIWIFVLDGFGQEKVQDEVVEFIKQLAQHISKPEFARKLRLVLLHFDQPLFIGNWRARTVDDGPLTLGSVTPSDLEDCLIEFNSKMRALNRTAKMIDPAEIPQVAAGIIARSNGAQLPHLYEQLLAIATS